MTRHTTATESPARVVFEGRIPRTEAAMRRSLELRGDRRMMATARLTVDLEPEPAN
jgi:hypothetical protein